MDEGRCFLRGGVTSGWDSQPRGDSGTPVRPRTEPDYKMRLYSAPGSFGRTGDSSMVSSNFSFMAVGAERNVDASHISLPVTASQNLPGRCHSIRVTTPALPAQWPVGLKTRMRQRRAAEEPRERDPRVLLATPSHSSQAPHDWNHPWGWLSFAAWRGHMVACRAQLIPESSE